METLETRVLSLFKDNPSNKYTNTDLCNLLPDISERKMRKLTHNMAEANKLSVSGRRGPSNLYGLPSMILYSHQKSYHEGYEAGIRASNMEAFNEGKRAAIRSVAKKLNIQINV